jgi:hypothetical protein
MVERTMEVSTQGLKFSLRTFLSDSAPGLLVVTLLMVGPFYNQLLSLSKDHHQEILIAILIAMLLLAIPLGLAIDALGWFFFGGIMQWLEQLWFKMGEIDGCFSSKVLCASLNLSVVVDSLGFQKEKEEIGGAAGSAPTAG